MDTRLPASLVEGLNNDVGTRSLTAFAARVKTGGEGLTAAGIIPLRLRKAEAAK